LKLVFEGPVAATGKKLQPNWTQLEIQLQLLGFHNEQLQLYNWLQLVATCGFAVA